MTQMSCQDWLVEYESPFSIIIIPVMLASSSLSMESTEQEGWKACGNPPADTQIQVNSGIQTPAEGHPGYTSKPTAPFQQHLFLLPSTWLKSHHPQTKKVKENFKKFSGRKQRQISALIHPVGGSSPIGRGKLGKQWRCGGVSVAVSSPLMTCFLPFLCKPFPSLTQQREREREQKVVHAHFSTSPAQHNLPPLFIQICQWAALPLSRPITDSWRRSLPFQSDVSCGHLYRSMLSSIHALLQVYKCCTHAGNKSQGLSWVWGSHHWTTGTPKFSNKNEWLDFFSRTAHINTITDWVYLNRIDFPAISWQLRRAQGKNWPIWNGM